MKEKKRAVALGFVAPRPGPTGAACGKFKRPKLEVAGSLSPWLPSGRPLVLKRLETQLGVLLVDLRGVLLGGAEPKVLWERMTVPGLYRVSRSGATVRKGVELTSPKLGRIAGRALIRIASTKVTVDGVTRCELHESCGKVGGGWVPFQIAVLQRTCRITTMPQCGARGSFCSVRIVHQ